MSPLCIASNVCGIREILRCVKFQVGQGAGTIWECDKAPVWIIRCRGEMVVGDIKKETLGFMKNSNRIPRRSVVTTD